jgi:hypothetical protein
MNVAAGGDDADGLELAALDEARRFFSPDVRLEIVPSYEVQQVTGASFEPAAANGKRYYAHVTVRVVER